MKTANTIAQIGFKKVIAVASETGMCITAVNNIVTPTHPQKDLRQ